MSVFRSIKYDRNLEMPYMSIIVPEMVLMSNIYSIIVRTVEVQSNRSQLQQFVRYKWYKPLRSYLFGHLSFRLKLFLMVTFVGHSSICVLACLSVGPSANVSHFCYLYKNNWANLNKI